ncbi:MAG: A/G-specific adenine glycosylase [Acidobacteriaceae bacterium]|nr:A/G-specific adenine glycosylase [Acidobacteriaceae bacterium]
MLSDQELRIFRRDLLAWYAGHKRDLPWRRTKDPYAIWISETMLQQTRVAAVIPYYERFLAQFPDVHRLAAASESTLLASWAGLGYYYRARNLQKAARLIAERGEFPATHFAIRQLPGVGDYTAAAVASIAFDLPHGVVDGNVLRVLSRVLADGTNIASSAGRKKFAARAQTMLDPRKPAEYNQSIMELGATVCLPKNPQCLTCPVGSVCKARGEGRQNEFPVKILTRKSVEQERTVYWIEREGSALVWQRPDGSKLMAGFWELPEPTQLPDVAVLRTLGHFRHGITFHSYRFSVVEASIPQDPGCCRWVRISDLEILPVSTVLRKAVHIIQSRRRTAVIAAGTS